LRPEAVFGAAEQLILLLHQKIQGEL